MLILRELRSAVLAGLLIVAQGADARRVHQEDLDAWVGVPVEALDTHSIFLTLPMVRTVTESGIEIRDYVNGQQISQCYGGGGAWRFGQFVNRNAFGRCTSSEVACHNIFYIKGGKVLEYAPTGRCYTNKDARPQERYRTFVGK